MIITINNIIFGAIFAELSGPRETMQINFDVMIDIGDKAILSMM